LVKGFIYSTKRNPKIVNTQAVGGDIQGWKLNVDPCDGGDRTVVTKPTSHHNSLRVNQIRGCYGVEKLGYSIVLSHHHDIVLDAFENVPVIIVDTF
jgi:hypothetical protein